MSSSNISSGHVGENPIPSHSGDISGPVESKQAADAPENSLIRVNDALPSGLYIVSTPIGNLRDITLRALDILGSVDLVLAEDTRVGRKLLDAYGLNPPLRPYHDHNGAKVRPALLRELADGRRVALISDAGTPLVSDPGFKLVREAIAEGVFVTAIPGASAPLTALAISGLPSDSFLFAGFPPPRQTQRLKAFRALEHIESTLIFFEGPSRLADSLADMAQVFGPRPAVLARELTKKFEEARRTTLDELAAAIREEGPPRGELVVLVGPPQSGGEVRDEDLDSAILEALETLAVKQASGIVAERFGLKKRDVYARAQALKDRADEGAGEGSDERAEVGVTGGALRDAEGDEDRDETGD